MGIRFMSTTPKQAESIDIDSARAEVEKIEKQLAELPPTAFAERKKLITKMVTIIQAALKK